MRLHQHFPAYLFFNTPTMSRLEDFIGHQYSWIWFLWLLSQTWITIHIWSNDHEKLMSTEQLLRKPMYDAFLIDQSLAMNRRREHDRLIKIGENTAHIFFDDAFIRQSQDDQDPHVNEYVLSLIDTVSDAASKVHAVNCKIKPPTVYSTPYGGRLEWTLPGKTKMIAHLKDKAKIRAKKRWSQVMYMYYLLGFRIMDNDQLEATEIKNMAHNTYILALDGDIDFQPAAVHLLVDYMKKNSSLGAACGRIHPVGSGAMAWYQVFEYAVGHWLQKATEHVIGCVLCSPGCFSLFRAGALMDDNVMAKYTTESSEARHYVQYDQGEDRWLCTLLLQRGYRVEYSAASDAYTHCPEGFNEFYNQRRRWMPSTTANIMDLLTDYKHIVSINDNISKLYILYQVVIMIGTVIGPGTIFLMLVGAFVAAFKISQYESLIWNAAPVLVFIIVCATCKSDTQLFFAALITGVYGLIMMTVFVGMMIQIEQDGWLAPSSLFLVATMGEFLIAALMHPQEFYCLKYLIIYYVTIPSMYMLLVIYSIFNMNNVSWGTREVTVAPKPPEANQENAPKAAPAPASTANQPLSFLGNSKHNAGSFEFSFGGLFKLLCCTYDSKGEEREMLRNIQTSIQNMQRKLDQLEKNKLSRDSILEPRKTARQTELFVGLKAARASQIGTPLAQTQEFANEDGDAVDGDDEDDYSNITASEDVEANSWYYDGNLIKSGVEFIDKKEKKFWEKLIEKYLTPLDDTHKKDAVAKDLKDLRDRMVMTFFMLNALFVLIIYLLNLQQDIIHVNWPVNPKVNFTYVTDENMIIIQKTYLQLQPIGFVFLIMFSALLLVQFIGMGIHRFGTYCQIMANTHIDFSLFGSEQVKNLTEKSLLERDPIKIFKQLIRLQGINDEIEEENTPVIRRETAHWLALKREKKPQPVIEDLEQAFYKRLSLFKKGVYKEENLPRDTIPQIARIRNTIMRRSQITEFTGGLSRNHERPNSAIFLENPAENEAEG
ncbi:unnamed protein product [Diabrotica balteata]|uniref:chitin synthase n=1 Tax=Diabrotica balteata TaxID=107213 RepID=A0A9P0GZ02_DIABA|nr:unnamed protein product [Diabrotica balteata]